MPLLAQSSRPSQTASRRSFGVPVDPVSVPGVVFALTGNFMIVGPMTLAVLPLNALLASVMYRRRRRSLTEAGLRVRRGGAGFALFFLLYQLFMSPVSVSGYVQELLRFGRRW